MVIIIVMMRIMMLMMTMETMMTMIMIVIWTARVYLATGDAGDFHGSLSSK